MRILVYGAGNIGSLYAALLKESGQDVSILARGKRLADIREHGIELEDFVTGKKTTAHVKAVARLDAAEDYDVVLVVLPKNHISEVLPLLRESLSQKSLPQKSLPLKSMQTPSFVFFGNNAAGSREMTEALGRERVLLGFPGAAAVSDNHTIRYLILSKREQPTTLGELDGASSVRIEALADALRAAGFPVSICSNMDAWLKTHAAEISPTANALYAAGADIHRLVRTRDAQVLMLRAIREGYSALSKLGIPITPRNHVVFRWLPEPVLLFFARRMLASAMTDIKIGHALGARDEFRALAEEFRELVREAGVPAPSIDILSRHLDLQTEPLADGSSQIRRRSTPSRSRPGQIAMK